MWGIAQPTQPYTPQLQPCCSDNSELRQSIQYVDRPLSVLPPSISQSHASDNNNMVCSK
ncbi:Cytochrome c-552 [Gossypium arboreum]|uniref:Cytochrome c-552 n=1 Tax=Gossypium arboreum TaxID=29729 RepID=A0A0B0PPQ0_GOSAR|nr:Cytochrome c-552 [Gossypium arboreum]